MFVCPGLIFNAAGNKSHYNIIVINRRCAAVTLNHNECARRAKEQQLIIFTNRHTRIKAMLLQLKASAGGGGDYFSIFHQKEGF